MVGCVDCSDVAETLARVPITELADWCVVNLVEDRRIVQSSVAQRDPGKAALRDAAMRAVPAWTHSPLWSELRLTSGFQLLTDVSDDMLRRFTRIAVAHRGSVDVTSSADDGTVFALILPRSACDPADS